MINPTDLPAHNDVAVEVSRVIHAPITAVFDAWIRPELRKRWWACGSCDVCEIDARVGGLYRIGTHDSGKGQAYIAVGEFQLIDRPTRLTYTWSWQQPEDFVEDSLVSVRFEEVQNGTRVHVTHSRFATQGHASPHRDGWEQGLEALASLLESEV